MDARAFPLFTGPASRVRRSGTVGALATVFMLSLPVRGADTTTKAPPADHAHAGGAHGGLIVPLGRDSYHVEPVFETDGVVRLYVLGSDETRVQDIERQTLTAYGKAAGTAEAVPFRFEPEPQEGDAEGKTSRFKAALPSPLVGRRIEVTIPIMRIASERFRLGFSSAAASHAEEAMPATLPADESARLFLTPGGKYTAADIEANGRRTSGQKFANFTPKHDLKPKSGDKICPITLTKANPECSWIIDGKTYEFCCPPCVEEFVRLAKDRPDEIEEPAAYVKK
jgi:YHS domain-containing protein